MKSPLSVILSALVFLVLTARAEANWADVGEITLTLPKGSSKAAEGHYVRVTFLKDGTAVKRDFTNASVSNGTLPKGTFESLAKSVIVENAFGKVPEGEPTGAAKEAVVVKGDEKRKFRVPTTEKNATLDKIEAAIDKVRWAKI